MDDINSFKGDHAFLSNFYSSPFEYEEAWYPTAEHAFQAAKAEEPKERDRIRLLASPRRAKLAGREVRLRSDWESVRIDVMRSILAAKFQDPGLRRKLVDTYPVNAHRR